MAEPGPDTTVPELPLAELEDAVRQALAAGDDSGLRVLGYGEISLVIGWPSAQPEYACKRLPPFASRAAADSYGEQFQRYLDLLAERGVEPVPSSLQMHADGDTISAYVVQPVLPAESLGPEVLRRATPDPDHPLLSGIVAAVAAVCDERTGLDAQVSNWSWDGSHLRYLDVTTPMLFGPDGRPLLDLAVFLAAYPWALRGVLGRFVAPGVIGAYREPRNVLVDLAANLLKERLVDWLPAAVAAANRVARPAIEVAEVERYYRSDARLWEVMLRLRRADRWWQRRIRRRPYPFLLPGSIER